MGETHDCEKIRLSYPETDDEKEFILVPVLQHENNARCREAVERWAETVDALQPTPGAHGIQRIAEAFEEYTCEESESGKKKLTELMQDWQRHITLEWPEGVKLVVEDPDAFDGDPKPRLALSEELQDALEAVEG